MVTVGPPAVGGDGDEMKKGRNWALPSIVWPLPLTVSVMPSSRITGATYADIVKEPVMLITWLEPVSEAMAFMAFENDA